MRYAIRVTKDGQDMWLRQGARIGQGAIVLFPSRAKAERFAENMRPGLDADDMLAVVEAPIVLRAASEGA